MIAIKRAAVGALVLRPASGGVAIKLQLACALPALRVRLDMARQGPPGPAGGGVGGSSLFRQVLFQALAAGAQVIPLGIAPVLGGFMQVFINGVLHLDVGDYSVAGSMLTLTEGVGVYAGDHILVVFQ